MANSSPMRSSSPIFASSPMSHRTPSVHGTPTGEAQDGSIFNPSSHLTGEFSTDNSPTSTLSDSLAPITSNIRLDVSRSFRNVFGSSPATPMRQKHVRVDPSLLTCFEPSDKELYDLWAPKR